MDVEYKFLPWPNLGLWLGVLAPLLASLALYDALRRRSRILIPFWLVGLPLTVWLTWWVAAPVPAFIFAGPEIPVRLLLTMLLLAYLGLRAYVGATDPVPWYKRGFLYLLRTAALLLGFCLLLRPVVSWEETGSKTGAILFLFDVSRSMETRDVQDHDGGMITRAEAVDRIWERNRNALSDLPAARAPRDHPDGPRLRGFRFAVTSREIPVADVLKPGVVGAYFESVKGVKGDDPKSLGDAGTAYGDALDRIVQLYPQELFTAVVLVGDGVDNLGGKRAEAVARTMARLGINGARLHTVTVGKSTAPQFERYIAAGEMGLPALVALNTTLQPSCEFTFRGLGGKTATVDLLINGKPEGEPTRVSIPEGSTDFKQKVGRNWTAAEPGRYSVALRARVEADPEPIDGRPDPHRLASPVSGQAAALVRVQKRDLRVLYIDRIRPESRFVQQALAAAGDLILERRTLTRRADDNGLPPDLKGWLAYDVYVLGDIPMDWFTLRQQTDLTVAVAEHGRGLLAMGGFRAFGAGGYVYDDGRAADAPLAALLPVRCRADDTHVEGPLRVRPTREGLRDGPCGLSPNRRSSSEDPNAEASWEAEDLLLWEQLGPLDGANRMPYAPPRDDGAPDDRPNSVKPGSTVFAVASTDPNQAILVGSRRGKGRVLALAIDTTWKWVFRAGADEAYKQRRELHHRFWRQMISWLHVPRPDILFHMARDTYFVPQLAITRPRVHALVQNLTSAQQRRLTLTAKVSKLGDDGASTPVADFRLVPASDGYEADITGELKAGRYEVNLAVEGLPTDLERFEPPPPITFRVEDRDLERLNVGARPDRMATWAQEADERDAPGVDRAFLLEQFPQLIETLKRNSVEQVRTVRHVRDILAPPGSGEMPWQAWAIFAACLVLLMAEWMLRKVWGMV